MYKPVVLVAAGLALATAALAADGVRTIREVRTTTQVVTSADANFLDLSRQLSSGVDNLRQQVQRGEPQSGKVGQRILNNLLGGDRSNRDGRGSRDGSLYRDLDSATRDVVDAARRLEHGSRGRRSNSRSNGDAERSFKRAFHSVERISGEVDRSLTAPTARGIFNGQVVPAMQNIRAALPTLESSRDGDDRRSNHDDRRWNNDDRRSSR